MYLVIRMRVFSCFCFTAEKLRFFFFLFILSKLSQLGNECKILHPQFNSPLQLILAFHSH